MMVRSFNAGARTMLSGLFWRIGLIALLVAGVGLAYTWLQDYTDPSDQTIAVALADLAAGAPAKAPLDPKAGMVLEDIWKPATTPPGGVAWSLLESTEEVTRVNDDGFIMSKPAFPDEVRQLAGKRVKVAGWMMPLGAGADQTRFLLMAYPPGCPFHFHAAPTQFIEVIASTPFATDERNALIVSGVLELTGEDESGIFYKMTASRPG